MPNLRTKPNETSTPTQKPSRRRSRRPSDLFGSVYESLGNRLGARLLKEVISAPSLAPRLTLPKALAYFVAACIHGLTLLTAALGAYVVIRAAPNPLLIALGLLLLLIAFELRPRFARLRKNEAPLAAGAAPALRRLADAIAAELHTSRIDAIIVTADWNASMGRYGWRRRKVLRVGLPLFAALDGQERVPFSVTSSDMP